MNKVVNFPDRHFLPAGLSVGASLAIILFFVSVLPAQTSGLYLQQGQVPVQQESPISQAVYDANSPETQIRLTQGVQPVPPQAIPPNAVQAWGTVHAPTPGFAASQGAPVQTPQHFQPPYPTQPYAQVAYPPQQQAPPSPAPLVMAPPAQQVSREVATKTYRLQNLRAVEFERKLIEKLGRRFVPVRNVEGSDTVARFRLPGKDGTNVELQIDRPNGVATIVGSAAMSESCLRIVQLLDTRENTESNGSSLTTQFVEVQRSNLIPVKKAAEVLNRQTQATAKDGDLKVAQNPSALRRDGVDPRGQDAAVIVGPVQIDIIDEFGTMALRGPKRDVEQIRVMLNELEAMSLEYEPVIELVDLKNADAYRISTMVQQLYQQIFLARKGNVTMLPLVKPNTILLAGQRQSVDTAKELIAKLDMPVAPETEFQIIRLKNASSDTLQTQITNFYANTNRQNTGLEPKVFVVSDSRTNSLIVQASPRDMTEVVDMVRQLDAPGGDAINTVKTFHLKHAMASELATTLQNAITGSTSGTQGFSNTGSAQGTRTRSPMLTMGTIDEDGNLLKSSVLYDVRIVANTTSNTLIVTAPVETMPLIEALIKELDQLPSAEAQIKVFTLVNGDAYTLANTVLTTLFSTNSSSGGGFGGGTQNSNQIATVRPGIEATESTLVSVRFVPDIRTNSIIACGSAGDMAVVEAILMRLDEDNMNNRKIIMFQPINARATTIATAIQSYVDSERTLENQNSTYLLPQSPQEQYRKEVVAVAEDVSNRLIVSTTPRYFDAIRKIVAELDERPLMVSIQVLIAEVTLTNNRERGIELGLQDSLLFDRSVLSDGVKIPGFLFGDPSNNLPLGDVNSGTVGTQGVTSLGTGRTGSSGYGGFTFSASSESVSVLIRALEEQGRLRILSRPHITALHNNKATISVGQRVPYVTGTDSGYNGNMQTSVDFYEVGTILDVYPRIMPDGTISMAIHAERSKVLDNDGVTIAVSNNTPIISPKVNQAIAETIVYAMDGQTIAFAGLISEEKQTTHRSVPLLNKIPVVKHLFEYKATTSTRSELLIIMTPTIIRGEMDQEILRQQEASRMHWCINDVVKLYGNPSMVRRGDHLHETEYVYPEATIVDETLLPSEEKVKRSLPVPMLAPMER